MPNKLFADILLFIAKFVNTSSSTVTTEMYECMNISFYVYRKAGTSK